jgi:hypothetical protein
MSLYVESSTDDPFEDGGVISVTRIEISSLSCAILEAVGTFNKLRVANGAGVVGLEGSGVVGALRLCFMCALMR